MPRLHNLFQIIRNTSNSFSEASIPKNKNWSNYKKERQQISLVIMGAKILNKILSNQIKIHESIMHHSQMGYIVGIQDWFKVRRKNQCNWQTKEESSHMVFLIGTEKVQYPCMIKSLSELGMKAFLSMIKGIYKNYN